MVMEYHEKVRQFKFSKCMGTSQKVVVGNLHTKGLL